MFKKLLNILNVGKPPPPPENIEALRIDFKTRYHAFQLLLSANNKALESMATIEQALQGRFSFGMPFIRTHCTSVSVNVYRMIKNMMDLAPGKYPELYDRFNEIQMNINRLLVEKQPVADERLVIPMSAIDKDMADSVGNKMATLGEIRNRVELRVPNGFVVTAHAYRKFFEHNRLPVEIDRRFQSADVDNMEKLHKLSSEIHRLIVRSEVPEDLGNAILAAYAQLEQEEEKGVRAAMRSSGLSEDVSGFSFAGHYRSELNIRPENIISAYKAVLASNYSLPAIAGRLSRGSTGQDVAMCVGCLAMIDAAAGGVMYSRNPMDPGDDSVFINSVWGLPKPVCDGTGDSDLFVVSREKPMTIRYEDPKQKLYKFVCVPEEGICRVELNGEESRSPSLTQGQAFALAEMAIDLEAYYLSPQDIEWAIAKDGTICLLQSRPLQQMEKAHRDYPKEIDRSQNEAIISRRGVTASPGAAAGAVFIVETDRDFLRFPEGAILVARQALPRWAPLLKRARGVVTEQGGFAGHLANVARERGLPALFGVEGITEKLTHGVIVTVDADSLAIYKGRVDSLLADSRFYGRRPKAQGPRHDTLEAVSRHIVPLNLLDPDSPDFHPKNCHTYHDITRFVHEKAVQEMFDVGKDHHFPERSVKQLHYRVPMNWWILNLDDGFKEEVDGKYIRLENIDSTPMMALWDGLTAVPWDGPPPVDGKGLMSVIFQATANTALTTGTPSQYAEKNYFMISKNFCSLTSRLGFHFSTVESMLSDRTGENYISFHFKGGAADYQRRLKRVLFVGEILEENGFKIDIREDNLIARVENEEKNVMVKQLKILGYLTLHTRQLDMIMANDSTVHYYRSKIKKEIRDIIQSHEKKPDL